MSRWSILIRILLSSSLVLNGLGTSAAVHASHAHTAGAATHVGPIHGTAGSASASIGHLPADADIETAAGSASAPSGTDSPCHGTDGAPAAEDSRAGDANGAPSSNDSDSLPECCRDAGCAGACLQHSPAATMLWIPLAVVTAPGVVSVRSTPHVLPERPPLTRPPDV